MSSQVRAGVTAEERDRLRIQLDRAAERSFGLLHRVAAGLERAGREMGLSAFGMPGSGSQVFIAATVVLMVGAYFGALRAIVDGYDLRPVSGFLAQAQSARRTVSWSARAVSTSPFR